MNSLLSRKESKNPKSTAQIYKKNAYNRSVELDKISDQYKQTNFQKITFSDMCNIIERISEGLSNLGVDQKTRTGIMSSTRIEWSWTDLAILNNQSTVVPIYKDLKSDKIEYIFSDANIDGVIVEGQSEIDKIVNNGAEYDFIVSFDDIESDYKNHYTLNEVITTTDQSNNNSVSRKIRKIDRSSLATIVYTSGTTSRMKGVFLTHGNLLSAIEQINSLFNRSSLSIYDGQMNLAHLPLSHIYARITDHYHGLTQTGSVAYAESTETLLEDVAQLEPNLLYSVPRLYQRLDEKLSESVPQPLLRIGKDTARKWIDNKGQRSPILRLKYKIMDKLLYSKIRGKFGGNLDAMVSGGGKIPNNLLKILRGMSLPIIEGYGLTETTGAIAVNDVKDPCIGSIGGLSKDTEVRVDSSALTDELKQSFEQNIGELLVKGPHVSNHIKSESENNFTEDGYLRTGDIFRVIDDNLYYYDRLKLVIVLDTGKNIAPLPIEEMFSKFRIVQNIMLIGDDKPFISALVTPNFEYIRESSDIKTKEDSERKISRNKSVQQRISSVIDEVNANLSSYEKIRDFRIIPSRWTVENGYLTPSLKIKRRRVREDYQRYIEDMYQ